MHEVHRNASVLGRNSAICEPPACATGTGYAFEDLRLLAESETAHPVLWLPRDAAQFEQYLFGRAVAVFNKTVAVAGQSTDSLRDDVAASNLTASRLLHYAGAVQVVEDIYDPLLPYRSSINRAPYAWQTPRRAILTPPADPVSVVTGVTDLYVPFLVSVDQPNYGTALTLAPGVLAVGSPHSWTLIHEGPSPPLDAVIIYRASGILTTNVFATSDGTPAQSASSFMAALLAGGASLTTMVLVDPATVAVASDVTQQFSDLRNSKFGASVDLSGDGRVLAVGAPGSDHGKGRVYVYTLDAGAPQLACYFSGGLPGFSALGEAVSIIDVSQSESARAYGGGTVATVAATFHGLAVSANGTIAEVAASVVLAVRPFSKASNAAFQPSMSRLVSSRYLADYGIPRCPVVSVVSSDSALDLSLQLGLEPTATTGSPFNYSALVSAYLEGIGTSDRSPASLAVAAAGGSLLLSDASVRSWTQTMYDTSASTITPDLLNNTQSLPTAFGGTGRVWHTAFCPRDSSRRKSEPQFAVVPYLCRSCGEGESSFGGGSALCSTCSEDTSACAGGVDSAGSPTDTLLEVTDDGLQLVQGGLYRAYVRGITASGRFLEKEGPIFLVGE